MRLPMCHHAGVAAAPGLDLLPVLVGERVTLRPGAADDVAALREILSEPSVMRWWRDPPSHESIAADLSGESGDVLLVIEVDGAVAGGIQYAEENEPDYRHAGIDIFLSTGHQGRGLGAEAVGLLVRFLIDRRHHHRLTIDPATGNAAAVRCYERAGFRPVGIMREYERGADGVWHDGLLMDLLASDLTRG
ncbi:MAG: aminoglycoside 6-N-acetyltransferase [Chloroflexota bacterium]|jgi:aminoglycoside 6'-N-acetyltransferase|nr:aminoglycoside 6-N-acetyltransferase [Chloroflexota bacterium]